MQININDLHRMMEQQIGGFGMIENKEWLIQIWLGDVIVQEQKSEMPEFVVEGQFKQVMQQLLNEQAPMKARFGYQYHLKDGNVNEDYIEYTNPPWDNAHKAER